MASTDNPDPEDLADLIDLNQRIATRTSIPGIVTGTRKVGKRVVVSVQISPKTALRDGRFEDHIEIDRVPIGFLTGGGVTIRCSLEAGDGCMCMVSDRTLAGFLTSAGKTYKPIVGQTHDPRDIVALPILTPDTLEPSVDIGAKELYIGDNNGKTAFLRLNVAKGTLTVESTAQIDIKCAGPVNLDSPAVTLGTTGIPAPIARVGIDFVVVPPGGGTVPILPGPAPGGGPPSPHQVKG